MKNLKKIIDGASSDSDRDENMGDGNYEGNSDEEDNEQLNQ